MLYSVQHRRSTATRAAALELPNLNYMHRLQNKRLGQINNVKQKRAKEGKKTPAVSGTQTMPYCPLICILTLHLLCNRPPLT